VIHVEFKLTDLENRPLPGVPVRVVLGPGWDDPKTGERFVTDAGGVCRFAAAGGVEVRRSKFPTNFVSSLFSRPQSTDFIAVAVELAGDGGPLVYVVGVFRFRDRGETMRRGMSLYAPDRAGRFTLVAQLSRDGDWRTSRDALVLPEYQPWGFALAPARDGWSLELGYQRLHGAGSG